MSPASGRAAHLAAAAHERELDVLLVTSLVNIRWLTGFTGSNALAILGVSGEAPARIFLSDFRYTTQAEAQVPPPWDRREATQELVGPALAEHFPQGDGETPLRVGFDDRTLSVQQLERIRTAIGERAELVPAGGLVEELREIKDAGEVSRIREAARLADTALSEVVGQGLVGRSEAQVALDLEVAMRRHGAEAISFPPIVASGPHGALPHAEPRAVPIEADVLVTIDWGAQLEGYCSDCTRTFATGEVGADERAVYDLVLRAQEISLAAVRPGPSGRELDAVARDDHRGRRLRGRVRARPGPRRRARDPRGAASLTAGARDAARRGHDRDGRARDLPAGAVRRADRGPRRDHRDGLRRAQHPAEGPAGRRLSGLVIDRRFEGPPGSANGGYVAGALAARLPAGAAVEVTLHRPVPLDVELEVAGGTDGAAELRAGEASLATARPAPGPDVGPVPDIGLAAARAAAQRPEDLAEHPFPRCFGCGPQRSQRDAVALHPGPVEGAGGVWATAWTPGAGLPHRPDGTLAPEIVWVALDCPSSFGTVPVGAAPHVLGRLQGRVGAPLLVGEEVAVLAWPLGHEGRKRWGASAIVGPAGDVRAVARATWIALR